jgi:hypothetical protein
MRASGLSGHEALAQGGWTCLSRGRGTGAARESLTVRVAESMLDDLSTRGGRMYARVASFEGGDLDRIRQLSEERMQSGEMVLPDAVTRTLVLADRDANRRLFVTFFDSREAIDAAEQRFEQMGDEIPEDVRGRRISVDVFEVVFDE